MLLWLEQSFELRLETGHIQKLACTNGICFIYHVDSPIFSILETAFEADASHTNKCQHNKCQHIFLLDEVFV